MYHGNTWPDGIVPYRFVTDVQHPNYVNPDHRQRTLDAFAVLAAVADIQFVPWTNESDLLEIRTDNNPACVYSFADAKGFTICIHHWDFPGLGLLMHETMHKLGLWHEHQRVDRDPYIQVHPAIVNFGGYRTLPNPPFDTHILGEYDFASLMHYKQVADINGRSDRGIRVLAPYTRAWQWEIGTSKRPDARPSNGDVWVLQHLYGGDPPPRTFALQSPPDAALVGPSWTPEFSWAPSEQAAGYRLQVDDAPVFDAPVIDVETAKTSYTHPASLDPDTLYWWRVIASNAVGATESYPFRFLNFYTATAYPAALYVDDSAPPGGDGSSWASPLRDLATATEIAYASGGTTTEIRVAEGVYTPDFGAGERSLSFWLANGCALLGGYAGYGAPDPNARDIDLYETVLSGDLNDDDLADFVNIEDNSRHVVFSLFNPGTTMLEGFTVRGGRAEAFGHAGFGAGAVVDGGNPVIRRCRFVGNHAENLGAGLLVLYSNAAPTIDRCAFVDNRALLTQSPNGWLRRFESAGGGLRGLSTGVLRIINSIFEGNTADAGGAAAFTHSRTPITNALMVGNTAAAASGAAIGGGALWLGAGTNVRLFNATLANNSAAVPGGAIRQAAGSFVVASNSIFWANSPTEILGPTSVITYSDIQGGWPGEGNIDANPLFVDSDGPDNNPDTWEDNDYRLSAVSPCIDAADNTSVPADLPDLDADGDTGEPIPLDLDGNPRFVDDPATPDTGAGGCLPVDMGVYEYQEGSSYPVDLDGDGQVGVPDLIILLGAWGPNPGHPADLDSNGEVRVPDLILLLAAWGTCE